MSSILSTLALVVALTGATAAQALSERPIAAGPPPLPPGYVIGAADKLAISFWRENDLSAEVVVRPDGRISLPLINDVEAAGMTPEQLRVRLAEAASRFLENPTPTVVVREIHSRVVFITGNVDKPGAYPLTGRMTVLQLIASAGGLREFVSGKNIVLLRHDAARDIRMPFDYQAVLKGKRLQQNVEMRPGDTVIVP
jgi:polysaccharide export outer membrane protein